MHILQQVSEHGPGPSECGGDAPDQELLCSLGRGNLEACVCKQQVRGGCVSAWGQFPLLLG